MAYYYTEPSHTFSEYLFVPGYTPSNCTPDAVNLQTPLVKHQIGTIPEYELKLPVASAIMQAVTDDNLAIALAKTGGIGFIFQSQSIEQQAAMVKRAAFSGEIFGAGINTRDYAERIPALWDAGARIFCLDSSEGYSEWQKITLQFARERYGNEIKLGAGNIVDAAGFRFLADSGADFIKVGIGGGSICITREQKGIGRGQATALIEVAAERAKYADETGFYIPLCTDGGISKDYHLTLSLAMGADFAMMGRYFAGFEESPSQKVEINGQQMKEYWGEGSMRAKNWTRYDLGGSEKLSFEEGVDSYVPYHGDLQSGLIRTFSKVSSTMSNCGAKTLKDLHNNAKLTLVSSATIIEGGAHNVELR